MKKERGSTRRTLNKVGQRGSERESISWTLFKILFVVVWIISKKLSIFVATSLSSLLKHGQTKKKCKCANTIKCLRNQSRSNVLQELLLEF